METTQLKKLEVLHGQAQEFSTIQEEIKKAWCALAIPYFNYDHSLNVDSYYLRQKVEPFNYTMAEEINTIMQEYEYHAKQATVSSLISRAGIKKDTLKIEYCAEKNSWEKEPHIAYSKESALCILLSCTRQELLNNTIPGYTYKLFTNGKIAITGDIPALFKKWPLLEWEEIHRKARETEKKLKKALNIQEQE